MKTKALLYILQELNLLKDIDCNRLFNQYSSLGGKGGGKPTFVTGIIHKEKTEELMKHLIMDVRKTLQRSNSGLFS